MSFGQNLPKTSQLIQDTTKKLMMPSRFFPMVISYNLPSTIATITCLPLPLSDIELWGYRIFSSLLLLQSLWILFPWPISHFCQKTTTWLIFSSPLGLCKYYFLFSKCYFLNYLHTETHTKAHSVLSLPECIFIHIIYKHVSWKSVYIIWAHAGQYSAEVLLHHYSRRGIMTNNTIMEEYD